MTAGSKVDGMAELMASSKEFYLVEMREDKLAVRMEKRKVLLMADHSAARSVDGTVAARA